jgi:hypothetical protein
MHSSISQGAGQSCPQARGPLTIGESQGELERAGGTGRVTDGKGGADVSCSVKSNGTGFDIRVRLDSDTIETNSAGVEYNVHFNLTSTFPRLVPDDKRNPSAAVPTTGNLSIDDTLVQVGYNDPACAIRIWSLGENNGGGAVWGSFDCDNLTDPSTAGSTCSATGTFVFENCSK